MTRLTVTEIMLLRQALKYAAERNASYARYYERHGRKNSENYARMAERMNNLRNKLMESQAHEVAL